MHMANELLSPAVAVGGYVVAGGTVALAARKLRDHLGTELVPLMGVMGAFVFAAQMINFTLPAMAGTSDHLIGTVLLAVLLGPHAAIIAMTGVLIVQCLIFQDGGLLALGTNVINMGILPAYVGYGLWRVMIGRPAKLTVGRLIPAVWSAAFVAVALGAAAVCVEVAWSDRLTIPIGKFSMVMVGVHLISGAIEGTITCVVLVALYRLYPNFAPKELNWHGPRLERGRALAAIAIVALVVAGAVSWFASPYADGLEFAVYEKTYENTPERVKTDNTVAGKVDELQAQYALLPDYGKRSAPLGDPPQKNNETEKAGAVDNSWPNVSVWTSVSGLFGLGLTMIVIQLLARAIRRGDVQTS
jgi:cobalt/nickel transport system permease protein